jgi:putative ABC transport system permease protein
MLIFNQLSESFKFALHALQGNRLRTFLSLLGITIGIFAIILVYSVVDSLEKNIRSSVEELGDNILYVQKWPFGGGGDFPWWKYLNRPEPYPKDAVALEKRSTKAANIAYVFGTNSNASFRNNTVENIDLIGGSYGFAAIWNFNLSRGRYFTEAESNSGKPYCIIGAEIAEALFANKNPIGKRIKVKGRKLIIIGVFTKVGKSLIGQNYDEMVHVPMAFLQRILNPLNTQGNAIMIKAKDGVSITELKDETRGNLRALHRLKPKIDDDFSLNEISMLSQSLDSVFGVLGIAGTVIGGFSILVGGFGIANIMFVSVKERTGEIGIQKALGAKNSFILIQFLTESIILCLAGGVVGLLMVYGSTYLAAKAFEFDIYLSAGNVILGIGLSLVIGLISGFIPAWSASRMEPVDAIRFKV